MKKTIEFTPIEGWETESLVIVDCYERNLKKFTFFPADKKKIKLSLKASESFAINNFFSATSEAYNVLIRQHLEPKLPPCKQLENF